MNKLFYPISLVTVLFLFSSSGLSQNNSIDSLKFILLSQKEDTEKVNILNELSLKYSLKSDYINALDYAHEALALSGTINYKTGSGEAFINISKVESDLSNFAEALKNCYSALKVFEEIDDKKGIAYSLQLAGYYHLYQENETEALNYFLSSLKIRQEIKDIFGLAQTNNSIAEIYASQGRFNEALEKLFESLKIFENPGSPDWGIPYTLGEIGKIYEKQGSNAQKAGDNPMAVSKFLEADKKYLATLKIWEEIGRNEGVAETLVYLGKVNTKLSRFALSQEYLEKGLRESVAIHSKPIIRDAYQGLETLDSTLGKNKDAYKNYKMYILYRDSIVNEESTRKFAQTNMQYEYDKKETIVKAEQDRKLAESKRIKDLQLIAIAALILLLMIILYIASIQWRNNKQKKKANDLLTQQKEKVEKTLAELKVTQAQLIQSEKMASLGELTAGIAHEIQNPLNFVNNFADVNSELIAEMKHELNTGKINDAMVIANNIDENEQKIIFHGKRADAIVKGMLMHSRSSSGIKEPTDINALADEYLRLAYHGLRAKDKAFNATLLTDFDEKIGLINIIPQDIGRVILNLITNAFFVVDEKKKSGIENYEPTVSVSTKNISPLSGGRGSIEIIVKDNGSGIPKQVLDKIFQPFFTTKATGQGTGLGLSLSYDIVKAHGGELKVNTKEGEGSEFIIILPL